MRISKFLLKCYVNSCQDYCFCLEIIAGSRGYYISISWPLGILVCWYVFHTVGALFDHLFFLLYIFSLCVVRSLYMFDWVFPVYTIVMELVILFSNETFLEESNLEELAYCLVYYGVVPISYWEIGYFSRVCDIL